MQVRCKLQLTQITHTTWTPNGGKLTFQAVYDQSIPEDARFAKASPNGTFEIYVDNPDAFNSYELGKFYYFDSTPCEDS